LNDEFENTMESYVDSDFEESDDNPHFASSGFGDYRYRLRTPAKAIGSVALTFGQVAMLTMDYEYLNYGNANLSASDYNFNNENEDIQNIYSSTHNFRFGGEVRLGPGYLRGGYAYYASPFATDEPDVNANRNVISGGMGLRTPFFFVDASYSRAMNESSYYPYVPGIVDGAVIGSTNNSFMLTLGFRF
jgi:hypothetical protein